MKKYLIYFSLLASTGVFAQTVPAQKEHKFTLGAYMGLGPTGVSSEQKGQTVIVSQDHSFLFALGLGYKITESVSARFIGISNATAMGGVEIAF